ncbi:MAG: ZIP family metal transporter [Candidatus Woesearchaeota archaeon]
MNQNISILIFSFLFAFLNTLLGAAGILFVGIKEKTFKSIVNVLVAFTAGSLLGGAFFHLIPEIIGVLEPIKIFVFVVLGFILFLFLEEYLFWHHCGSDKDFCEKHREGIKEKSYRYLIIVGDFIHNIIDGFIIVGSFFVGLKIGIISSVLVLIHELSQEIGIFGVLVHGGFNKKMSIIYSLVAQSSVFLGVIFGYFSIMFGSLKITDYLMPIAAGGFIYIAASDLIPEVHSSNRRIRASSFFWIIVGILLMLALKIFFEV